MPPEDPEEWGSWSLILQWKRPTGEIGSGEGSSSFSASNVTASSEGDPAAFDLYTYTCQNKGGNVAPGQKSTLVVRPLGEQNLDNSDHNGRATLNVTAFPGTPATVGGTAAGCPNGNWTGVNPVADATTATLTIMQGGNVIYTQTFTKPS
jgi:hypothetical protein